MTTLSIITATCNAADTLIENINSIAKQSVQVEHILIDGASTDATMSVVEKYKDHFARIISEPDNGIYDAMNKGIMLATGDVIGILNADDVYATDKVLEKVASVFDDSSIEACYGDLVYIDQNDPGKVVRYWRSKMFSPQKMRWGWMPPHPTFFVRRSVYENFGLFNKALGTAADYEIMLRFLLKHRIKVAYIPEVLVKMRTGGLSNESLSNRIRANLNDRKAWTVNDLKPYPWTLWAKPLRKIGQWIVKGNNLSPLRSDHLHFSGNEGKKVFKKELE